MHIFHILDIISTKVRFLKNVHSFFRVFTKFYIFNFTNQCFSTLQNLLFSHIHKWHKTNLCTIFSQFTNSGKLKKWNTVDEVHRTTATEIPEAPNRKSGGTVNATLPPPPPPPPLPGGLKPPLIHLMKPLHVVTGSEGPPSPGSSSFYSPGM